MKIPVIELTELIDIMESQIRSLGVEDPTEDEEIRLERMASQSIWLYLKKYAEIIDTSNVTKH